MKQNLLHMKKIVMLLSAFYLVLNLMAQKKIDLDKLTADQLNLYKSSATTLRNTGAGLTVLGTGVAIIGGILISSSAKTNNLGEYLDKTGRGALLCTAGIITAGTGIPLWVVGSNRILNAELYLKKYDIKPANPMAVGVGFLLRF